MSKVFKAYIAYERMVKAVFARYFSNLQDIEDLAQEVFLKCYAAELKAEIREPKWFLMRAAKNLALSELKRKVRTTTDYMEESGGSEVYMDEDQVSAEALLDGRRKLAALARAVASMPEENRRAFLMRKLEELTFEQIATRIGVSERTAYARVAKALVLCDAFLRSEGYDPSEFRGLSYYASEGGAPSEVELAAKQIEKGRGHDR